MSGVVVMMSLYYLLVCSSSGFWMGPMVPEGVLVGALSGVVGVTTLGGRARCVCERVVSHTWGCSRATTLRIESWHRSAPKVWHSAFLHYA